MPTLSFTFRLYFKPHSVIQQDPKGPVLDLYAHLPQAYPLLRTAFT